MHDIYRQTTDEADTMLKQSTERFDLVCRTCGRWRSRCTRAGSHPQRAAPRRARDAAGGRREHCADAQGDRRPDRGARRAEPHRGAARPWPRRLHDGPRQRASARKSRRWQPSQRATPRPRPRHRQRLDPAAARPRRPPPPRRTEAPPIAPANNDSGPRRLAVGPAEPHGCRPGCSERT